MQGRRRSNPTPVEAEPQAMLSRNHGNLSLLPRSPVDAASSLWSFDFAASPSSSYQIDTFLRPFVLSDEILPPSIDLQEGLQLNGSERNHNEDKEGGSDRRMLVTESSTNFSQLQYLQHQSSGIVAELEFQDVAARNLKAGLLDEDCNTSTWQPLAPPSREEGFTTGCSKRPKLSEPVSSPLETKAELSPSQVKKLGGKITALQQLVSPFGKTDTASVLLKAIDYIKFLQEQVQVLSSPYMMPTVSQKIAGKRPAQSRDAQVGMDLRSRGLCLVPVSCTPKVANDNGADYWASGISRC